jgi:hypothetical protein
MKEKAENKKKDRENKEKKREREKGGKHRMINGIIQAQSNTLKNF